MTNVIQETNSQEQKLHPFGVRLQSARETIGMDRKDAAAHLRVHEKVIIMIESGIFNNDLPLAFIRGYIRSYSKLLEIPESEVKAALDLIKPKPEVEEEVVPAAPIKTSHLSSTHSIDSHNFFMPLFTALILVTLISLVAIWWHSHKTLDSQITNLPIQNVTPPINHASATNSTLAASAVDAGIEGVAFPSAAVENRSNANMNILSSQNTDLIDSSPAADTSQIIDTVSPAANKKEAVVSKKSFINLAAINSFLAPYFNHGDKLTVERAILGNNFLQLLFEFLLFLFILNFGLRKYYHHSLIYVTGGSRPSIRTTPKPFRPLSANIQTAPKYHLAKFFIFIFAIIGLAWYGLLHMKKSNPPAPIVKITPASETAMGKRPTAEDNFQQIYANLENLAPPSNLNAKLLSAFKVYPLQSIVDQLNHYISEASASKFILTDPSTDLGQFAYKKKSRHRHKPVVVHPYFENSDPYNDTETTN